MRLCARTHWGVIAGSSGWSIDSKDRGDSLARSFAFTRAHASSYTYTCIYACICAYASMRIVAIIYTVRGFTRARITETIVSKKGNCTPKRKHSGTSNKCRFSIGSKKLDNFERRNSSRTCISRCNFHRWNVPRVRRVNPLISFKLITAEYIYSFALHDTKVLLYLKK